MVLLFDKDVTTNHHVWGAADGLWEAPTVGGAVLTRTTGAHPDSGARPESRAPSRVQVRGPAWQGLSAGSRPAKYERGGTPIRDRKSEVMCDWSK